MSLFKRWKEKKQPKIKSVANPRLRRHREMSSSPLFKSVQFTEKNRVKFEEGTRQFTTLMRWCENNLHDGRQLAVMRTHLEEGHAALGRAIRDEQWEASKL